MTKSKFQASLMRLRKLSNFESKPAFDKFIEAINEIRSNYPWSIKTYDRTNIQNIWLICHKKTCFGYVEAEFRGVNLDRDDQIDIYIHDLHFAPSMQRLGAGLEIIRYLLRKGADVEFVVANCNEKVEGLIKKFHYQEKYVTENTKTIRIAFSDNI